MDSGIPRAFPGALWKRENASYPRSVCGRIRASSFLPSRTAISGTASTSAVPVWKFTMHARNENPLEEFLRRIAELFPKSFPILIAVRR